MTETVTVTETAPGTSDEDSVLRCADLPWPSLHGLVARFGLELERVMDGAPIPGSYWDPPEAGLHRRTVHARGDTPIHSLLHELCHAVCMTEARRAALDTEAGGDDAEENAVCYLQILLADHLADDRGQPVGRDRLMRDMDAWGYSFRLGSTRAWFEDDAEDARSWLVENHLLTKDGTITWHLRS